MTLSAPEVAFVDEQRVAHLATADADGRPHVVPVCFAYAEARFYIAIDEKPKRSLRLKRLRNIQANPHVALVIDDYSEDWTQLAYVIMHGTADILTSGPAFEQAVAALRQKYPQYQRMPIQDNPMIAVQLTRVVSWGTVS